MADSKEPYGPSSEAHYADPGYRPDKKKRYPLSNESMCRAAWSYISMPKNAAKYSPEDLKRVKSRIKAAGKKYGIDFADHVAASAPQQMLGVELARPGTWKLLTGPRTFTEQNLRDAADFFAASGQSRIPIGFGHTDSRFDGDPAFGWVSNIRYAEDAKGPVLLGDLVDMDDWVAAAAPRRWPNRSVEGFADLDWNGRTYTLALTRLALLGATPPAMPTLRSLADLRQAVAASAAACGAEFISASAPPSPAIKAAPPIETTKETGMDPAKFREALGLSDDVSDDEVMEALAIAGFQPASDPPEAPVPVAAAAVAPGTIVMASSIYEEILATNKQLKAFVDKTERGERDSVIAQAVIDGKFTPAQKPHFTQLWDVDPKGTRALINSLMRNSALAVAASGYAGEAMERDELDMEIERLSPPKGRVA